MPVRTQGSVNITGHLYRDGVALVEVFSMCSLLYALSGFKVKKIPDAIER